MDSIALITRDFDLRHAIHAGLGRCGLGVLVFAGAGDALRRLQHASARLAIVDLAHADDGACAIARLRVQLDIPLVAIGTGDDETDCVVALESGGDDFLARPLRPRELVARVRALLRRARGGKAPASRYRFAGCTFDAAERRLRGADGASLQLTVAEGRLLSAFVNAPQRVLSRERLVGELHAADDAVFDRSIDMRVLRLRRRLRSVGVPAAVIRTERSLGYVLQSDVDRLAGAAD